MTEQDLIHDALAELGVIAATEPLGEDEARFGRRVIRRMLDTWRTQRMLCYVIKPVEYQLESGKDVYTMGPTGDIREPRPVYVSRASIVTNLGQPDELESPLEDLLTPQQWHGVSSKLLRSTQPSKLYVEPTFPDATLRLWPVYEGGESTWLRLYVPDQFFGFCSDDDDDFTSVDLEFAPGHQEALLYGLAVRMAPSFGVQISPMLVDMASQSMAHAKRTHIASDKLVLDPALPGMSGKGFYNWRTDT